MAPRLRPNETFAVGSSLAAHFCTNDQSTALVRLWLHRPYTTMNREGVPASEGCVTGTLRRDRARFLSSLPPERVGGKDTLLLRDGLLPPSLSAAGSGNRRAGVFGASRCTPQPWRRLYSRRGRCRIAPTYERRAMLDDMPCHHTLEHQARAGHYGGCECLSSLCRRERMA
jgi:hypothetical protein